MRIRFLAGLLAVAAFSFTGACSKSDNPNAPDVAAITATAPAPSVPGSPASPAPSPDLACNIKDIVATPLNFTPGGQLPEIVKIRIANPKNTACAGVRLSSWNADDGANQIWFADSDGQYPPHGELSVKVPCDVYVQTDVNNSPFIPQKGQYSPGYFVVAFWGRGPSCTPPPPPPNPTCDNYTKPPITGDIASDIQATQVVISSGTVAPNGGDFNPTLPQTLQRPAPDQPPGSFTTVYTLPYGPELLNCSTSRSFTKPVPPKDQPAYCDMDIVKAVNRSSAAPEEEVTYRIEIVNSGTANCTGGGVQIFDEIPDNLTYKRERHANNGSFTGNQSGRLRWNFDVMVPGESGWVEWDAKITNPQNNCQDFTIRNRAKVWSQQQGDVHSNEVSTFVDVTCQACEPTHLNQADGCYKPNPWGNGNNPEVICGYFNLVPTFKDESGSGDSYQFTVNAAMVVVHWGGASCTVNGAQSYSFTENAVSGQTVINPAGNPGQGGFSFAQYCGCSPN